MIVSYIRLKNWRNFKEASANLGERVFLTGPNASGKSNFLDVFRFLRDLSIKGGGLQKAVEERGGLSKIRCLAARKDPIVEIEVHLSEEKEGPPEWTYSIGIRQRRGGRNEARLAYEKITHRGKVLLERPDKEDDGDEMRLSQTHLEQISANKKFREINRHFEEILYLHLVPQLVRHPREFSGPGIAGDPFGRSFLERISAVPARTRESRLKKIEGALRKAVPNLKQLTHVVSSEEGGVPHLEAIYDHWRPNAGKQREREFSDGTLRLIGLFWMLLENNSLLLMEEPELSLNAGIVRKLPAIFHQLISKTGRQFIVSTHSYDLLSDKGIDGSEVLLLTLEKEGTIIRTADSDMEIRLLLEGGMTVADAVLPRTEPRDWNQGDLFN